MKGLRELVRFIDCLLWAVGLVTSTLCLLGRLDAIDFHVCIADAGQCRIEVSK